MSAAALIVDVSLGEGPCYVINTPSGAAVNFGRSTYGFCVHMTSAEARELASALIACASRTECADKDGAA